MHGCLRAKEVLYYRLPDGFIQRRKSESEIPFHMLFIVIVMKEEGG
jgi:hypothetical protein